MLYNKTMWELILLIFFIILLIIAWRYAKNSFSAIFPYSYEKLLSISGKPLKKLRNLNATILNLKGEEIVSFGAVFQVAIYEDRVIAGVMGTAIPLLYSQYRFKREDDILTLSHSLIIEDISCSKISTEGLASLFSFRQEDPLVILKIRLSEKELDYIMSFVQKARQHTPAEQLPQ